MEDPPQREQENHDARSRDEQVPTALELIAELGTERADHRDVPGQVDQHDGEPGTCEQIPRGGGGATA